MDADARNPAARGDWLLAEARKFHVHGLSTNDLEDARADGVLRAVRFLGKRDIASLSDAERHRVAQLLHGEARNGRTRILRAKGRLASASEETPRHASTEPSTPTAYDPASVATSKDFIAAVKACLRTVPPQKTNAFLLNVLAGWTFDDIAAEYGVSRSTAHEWSRQVAAALASRRDLMQGLAFVSFVRLFGPTSTASLDDALPDRTSGILAPCLLTDDPDEILSTFLSASTGPLMALYQLPFPALLRGNPLEASDVIRDRGNARLDEIRNAGPTHPHALFWHRIPGLQALANAHGLARASRDEAEELAERLASIHRHALVDAPHHEILSILWQALVAALIYDDRSWRSLGVNRNLVDQAEALCGLFLGGEEMLLFPAAMAWQFLLTYERALGGRGDTDSETYVQRLLSRVEATGGPRYPWLGEIARMYEWRFRRIQMLPQLSEALIGRAHALGSWPGDFCMLMRTQVTQYTEQVADGTRRSDYSRHLERAADACSGFVVFARNYGVDAADWRRLRTLAEERGLPLAKGYREWGDHQFLVPAQESGVASAREREERRIAHKISAAVPFRRFVPNRAAD